MFERKTDSLRRLWLDDNSFAFLFVPHRENLCNPSITSFCSGDWSALTAIDINDQRFRHIHHLGGFGFARLDELSDLKYVRASCNDEQQIKVVAVLQYILLLVFHLFLIFILFLRLLENSVKHTQCWNLCISVLTRIYLCFSLAIGNSSS